MAMIKCPECGKELSDKAPACPNCGNPIASQHANQENALRCPKCGSTQIAANDKGFSLGKAAAGGVLLGGVGLLAGTHGGKRIKLNCLQCGHSWVPFDEAQKVVKIEKRKKRWRTVFLLWGGIILVIIALRVAASQ